ncbi:hypothetical protein [Pseudophaeobacter sp.]|uniref:hypothetical protein n=1 Tax=Pseudophaeobacter sp. TaxID=1971739 RepID=UPI00329820B3
MLFEVFETMGHASLGALPDEVFDLFLLSTIRLKGGAFTSVQQAGLLFDRLDRACAILETAKPDAIERLQLFKAIQEHTRGQEAKARKSLLDISKPTQFCGPFRAVDTVLGAHQRTVPNVSEIDVISRSDRSLVVVVSLNKKYFEKHLEGFLRSFFDTARGTVGSDDWGLHLHCVGFEPAETNWLDFKQPEIGVSLDWNSVAARRTAWEGAYCASARYLFAPLYLRMHSCLFVCDVDGVFTKPLEPPSGGCEDVLLTSNRYLSPQKSRQSFALELSGCDQYLFTGAEGSLNFADNVSGYLATIFQNEEFEGAPWYADQSALYYSFLDERERLKFGRLEGKYFQQGTDRRQFFSEETKKRFSGSSLNIEK